MLKKSDFLPCSDFDEKTHRATYGCRLPILGRTRTRANARLLAWDQVYGDIHRDLLRLEGAYPPGSYERKILDALLWRTSQQY